MGGAVSCAAECSPIPPRSARLATSGQIKTGSLRRSERNGRHNRLMEIAIRAETRSLASRR